MKRTKKLISLALVISMVLGTDVVAFASTNNEVKDKVYFGENRFTTAVEVSKAGWTSAKEVVLVNGNAMVDALSATPFAYTKGAPILLTNTDKLQEDTAKELKRLGTEKVYIIGGKGVVSDNVKNNLEGMKIIVERISGENRYETSIKVAKSLDTVKDVSEVAIVNGEKGLADAVSVASVAAQNNMPIISTKTNGDKDSYTWIKGEDIKASYLIGGSGVLGDALEKELPMAKRIGGSNRHETNANVIDRFFTDEELDKAYVAKSGMNKLNEIVDALAVGPLAARDKAPVIIVNNKLDKTQQEVAEKKIIKEFIQIGGGISTSTIKALKDTQQSKEFNVTTMDELKALLSKIRSNDVVNFRPSAPIETNIDLVTSKYITLNIYGMFKGNVSVNMPNAEVVNKGTMFKDLIIEDIKGSTFTNEGRLLSIKVNDTNGGRIVNSSTGSIERIQLNKDSITEIDGQVNEVLVEGNNASVNIQGSVDKVEIKGRDTKLIVKEKSTIKNVQVVETAIGSTINNSGKLVNLQVEIEGITIKNNGVIEKAEILKDTVVDGNKPVEVVLPKDEEDSGNTEEPPVVTPPEPPVVIPPSEGNPGEETPPLVTNIELGTGTNTLTSGNYGVVSVKGTEEVVITGVTAKVLNIETDQLLKVTNCNIEKINVINPKSFLALNNVTVKEMITSDVVSSIKGFKTTRNISEEMKIYISGGTIDNIKVNSQSTPRIKFEGESKVSEININTGALIESISDNNTINKVNLNNSKPVEINVNSQDTNIAVKGTGEVQIAGKVNSIDVNTDKKIKFIDGSKVNNLIINNDAANISMISGGEEKAVDDKALVTMVSNITPNVELPEDSIIKKASSVSEEDRKKIEEEKIAADNTDINLKAINECKQILNESGGEPWDVKQKNDIKIKELLLDSGKFIIPEEVKAYSENYKLIVASSIRGGMHPSNFKGFENKVEVQNAIYQGINRSKVNIESSKFEGQYNSAIKQITIEGNEGNIAKDITDEVIKIVPGETLSPFTSYEIVSVSDFEEGKIVPNDLFEVKDNRIYILPSDIRENFTTNIFIRVKYEAKGNISASETNLSMEVRFTEQVETLVQSINRWAKDYSKKSAEERDKVISLFTDKIYEEIFNDAELSSRLDDKFKVNYFLRDAMLNSVLLNIEKSSETVNTLEDIVNLINKVIDEEYGYIPEATTEYLDNGRTILSINFNSQVFYKEDGVLKAFNSSEAEAIDITSDIDITDDIKNSGYVIYGDTKLYDSHIINKEEGPWNWKLLIGDRFGWNELGFNKELFDKDGKSLGYLHVENNGYNVSLTVKDTPLKNPVQRELNEVVKEAILMETPSDYNYEGQSKWTIRLKIPTNYYMAISLHKIKLNINGVDEENPIVVTSVSSKGDCYVDLVLRQEPNTNYDEILRYEGLENIKLSFEEGSILLPIGISEVITNTKGTIDILPGK
ncbi:cell wall-binding repeat-containing protein [Clostridium sp. UBA5988]|uniref:cell wall-binding repeat-containing protein n=1 Tax=Clostridium sp. UBA5988 TaxID=1946369 RepID=UPI003216CFE7